MTTNIHSHGIFRETDLFIDQAQQAEESKSIFDNWFTKAASVIFPIISPIVYSAAFCHYSNIMQETTNPLTQINTLNHMRDYEICLLIHSIVMTIILSIGLAISFLPLGCAGLVLLSVVLIGYQSYKIVETNKMIEQLAQERVNRVGRDLLRLITEGRQLEERYRRD